ncbi:MAG: PQQ-binding-like beta-propeller repeat protein [Streptosporangiales bacterium]|nr:PQQ-binding-like beta-propeller repeat protein [Streptosporangiales bacterium]
MTTPEDETAEPAEGEQAEPEQSRSRQNLVAVLVTVTVVLIIVVLLATLLLPGWQTKQYGWSAPSDEGDTHRTYVTGDSLVRVSSSGVAAYRLDTGKKQWQQRTAVDRQQVCAAVPEPAEGVIAVMVGTSLGPKFVCSEVRAIDIDSGKELWRKRITEQVAADPRPRFAVTMVDGMVVATDALELVAFDARTGKRQWRHGPRTTGCHLAGASSDGDELLTITQCYDPDGFPIDGGVQSRSLTDGEINWQRRFGAERGRIVNVDPLVVATDKGNVFTYDGDGKQQARIAAKQQAGTLSLVPDVDSTDGNAVVEARVVDGLLVGAVRGGKQTRVAAYRIRDGKRSWAADVGGAGMPWVSTGERGLVTFLVSDAPEDDLPYLVDVDARTGAVDAGDEIEPRGKATRLPKAGYGYTLADDTLLAVRAESAGDEPLVLAYS